MNAVEIMQGLDDLSDFYGRSRLEERQAAQWVKKLKWLDKRDFEVAVEEITSREKFFPTPAKVLEFADGSRARRAHNERQQDRQQASNFFKPERHNTQLSRECVEFLDMVFKLRGPEKWEFELSWAKAMLNKYSSNMEVAVGFRDMMREAKRKLDEYCAKSQGSEVVNG